MPYLRLVNDGLARILHQPLYQRLRAFCQQYTPELPSEPVIAHWLQRLYSGDPLLHILVRVTEQYQIFAHAVIDVQVVNQSCIVVCHQCQQDKPNAAHLLEGMEYIDKLVAQYQAYCSLLFTPKHNKAFTSYGYTVSRLVMIKQGCAHGKGEAEGAASQDAV